MTSTSITQPFAPQIDMPNDLLESLLREHLADPTAVVIDSTSVPFPHQGTNDSTTLFQVTFTWAGSGAARSPNPMTWIVKHWRAGGSRDEMLSIRHSREVLAWERGWLRPAALPPGLIVPFVGARCSPDHTESWLAMRDVSTELAAYTRLTLSGEQAMSRAQTILARLAHVHALWEQPERQAELQAANWRWRPDLDLWAMAPAPPEAGDSADLEAFLAARPAEERRLWERLLINREAVVAGLIDAPHTLIHNDLDDRNLGLHWPDGGATDSPAVVLIDWEWLALGPAVIDVAKIIQMVPILVTPGAPIPASVWGDELAQAYFAHYQAAGGQWAHVAGWRRTYGLAIVAQGLAQMPWIHGQLRRTIRGELPPPQLVGVPEAVLRQQLRAGLPIMEQMEGRVVCEARRWLA
jgi:thiamine kinase-like enzyme